MSDLDQLLAIANGSAHRDRKIFLREEARRRSETNAAHQLLAKYLDYPEEQQLSNALLIADKLGISTDAKFIEAKRMLKSINMRTQQELARKKLKRLEAENLAKIESKRREEKQRVLDAAIEAAAQAKAEADSVQQSAAEAAPQDERQSTPTNLQIDKLATGKNQVVLGKRGAVTTTRTSKTGSDAKETRSQSGNDSDRTGLKNTSRKKFVQASNYTASQQDSYAKKNSQETAADMGNAQDSENIDIVNENVLAAEVVECCEISPELQLGHAVGPTQVFTDGGNHVANGFLSQVKEPEEILGPVVANQLLDSDILMQGWLNINEVASDFHVPRFFQLRKAFTFIHYDHRYDAYSSSDSAIMLPLNHNATCSTVSFSSREGKAVKRFFFMDHEQGILKLEDAGHSIWFCTAVHGQNRGELEGKSHESSSFFPTLKVWDETLRSSIDKMRAIESYNNELPWNPGNAGKNPMSRSGDLITEVTSLHVQDSSMDRMMLEYNFLTTFPTALTVLTNLTILCLGRNQIELIEPEALGTLTTLKVLMMDGNRLQHIPSTIKRLTSLTVLRLDANRIEDLPEDSFGALHNLTELNVQDNLLKVFPADIGKLNHLSILLAHRNTISEIHPSCGGWASLKELWLNSNLIETLPDEISSMQQLEKLVLSVNRIHSLPHHLDSLTSLFELLLDHNLLIDFVLPTQELSGLHSLKILHLNNNYIGILPPLVGTMTSLTDLRVDCNKIDTIPRELCRLTNMRKLRLGYNLIECVPVHLGYLLRLEELELQGNPVMPSQIFLCSLSAREIVDFLRNSLVMDGTNKEFKTIPRSILQMTCLEYLKLSFNELEKLPVELTALHFLETLIVDHNSINTINSWIGDFKSLKELNLDHNRILRLPDEIGRLSQLKILSVEANLLGSLPQSMARLSNLVTLRVEQCPLRPPISDAYDEGGLAGLMALFSGNDR